MSDREAFTIAGAILALILLPALGAVRSSSIPNDSAPVQVNEEQPTSKRVDNHEGGNEFFPNVKKQPSSTNRQSDVKKVEADQKASEFGPTFFGYRFKITDGLLVLFTGILAWKTAGLDNATRNLWKAGERQIIINQISADAALQAAEVAKATLIVSNRAWLKVQIRLGSQPLMYGAEGMDCGFIVEAANVGKEPALNVTTHVWMVPWRTEPGQSPFQEISKRCEGARHGGTWMTHTLFPGETLESASGIGLAENIIRMPIDEVEAGLKAGRDSEGNPIIAVFVGGCVTYSFPSDPSARHLTGFIVEMRRIESAIRPRDCPIPVELLRLEPLYGGGLNHPD